MNQRHLLFLPLLVSTCLLLPGGWALIEVRVAAGKDGVLRCAAKPKDGVRYWAVRWYRVRDVETSPLSGLLSCELPAGHVSHYSGLKRQVALLSGSRSLLLPNVTCEDGGVYLCSLVPPVGEQLKVGQVLLSVTGSCSVENLMTESLIVVLAFVLLILGFLIFFISYVCVKNIPKDRNNTTLQQVAVLDAPLHPLDKKDLESIYRLGPKQMKMVRV